MSRFRRTILTLVALLAIGLPTPAHTSLLDVGLRLRPVDLGLATVVDTLDLASLDRYIEAARREWGIPGLAVAIVKDDSVIFARGYGEREYGSGEAVDEHTLFAIASTSKAFTAAALGILVDEGRIRWDDPVRQHLPEFELADPYVTRNVTIRDLLTHRVGVARDDNVWIAGPFDRAELVRRTRLLDQRRGLRAGYDYNNLMYVVAGVVVAADCGVSRYGIIEDRNLRPLGMERTTSRYAVVEAREDRK